MELLFEAVRVVSALISLVAGDVRVVVACLERERRGSIWVDGEGILPVWSVLCMNECAEEGREEDTGV